jgi:hypothetical protein
MHVTAFSKAVTRSSSVIVYSYLSNSIRQCPASARLIYPPQGIFSALSLREDIATTMILPIVMAIKKPPEGGLMVYPL